MELATRVALALRVKLAVRALPERVRRAAGGELWRLAAAAQWVPAQRRRVRSVGRAALLAPAAPGPLAGQAVPAPPVVHAASAVGG